jgi:hypothetical protein
MELEALKMEAVDSYGRPGFAGWRLLFLLAR